MDFYQLGKEMQWLGRQFLTCFRMMKCWTLRAFIIVKFWQHTEMEYSDDEILLMDEEQSWTTDWDRESEWYMKVIDETFESMYPMSVTSRDSFNRTVKPALTPVML